MTAETLERLRPLWKAADEAIRSDVSYVIDLANAGSALKGRANAKGVGGSGRDDVVQE